MLPRLYEPLRYFGALIVSGGVGCLIGWLHNAA